MLPANSRRYVMMPTAVQNVFDGSESVVLSLFACFLSLFLKSSHTLYVIARLLAHLLACKTDCSATPLVLS